MTFHGGSSENHSYATPRASKGRRPDSGNSAKLIASMFEHEAHKHLGTNLGLVLPTIKNTTFKNREIREGPSCLELDAHAYACGNYLGPAVVDGADSFALVTNGEFNPPVAAPRNNIAKSPGLKSTSCGGARTHLTAEVYSGKNESNVRGKVVQMEVMLTKIMNREEEQSGSTEIKNDPTGLIGAGCFVFLDHKHNRKKSLKYFLRLIQNKLSKTDHPILWRMMTAQRLFVVVLTGAEAPITLHNMNMNDELSSLKEKMDSSFDELSKKLDLILENQGPAAKPDRTHNPPKTGRHKTKHQKQKSKKA